MNKYELVLIFLLFVSWIKAQQNTYLSYGREAGLPQSQVRAIETDSAGFLWIGTLGGLSRFNGASFRNFSKEDGLPDNQINCLVSGKEFWIGTTGALCYLEGIHIKCIPLPQENAASRVLDIAEDPNGAVWLATAGEGILVFEDSTWHTIKTKDGLPDDYVRSLTFDERGLGWIGTRSGMMVVNRDRTLKPPPKKELEGLSVSKVEFNQSGTLIISTFGNGVFTLNNGRLDNYTSEDGLPGNFIRCFLEMDDGSFWFGAKDGLCKWNGEEFISFDERKGLPYDNVKSLGKDREGNLWIGTDGQGLLRKAGTLFSSFTTSEGLQSDLVMSFAKAENDSLYIGTYDAGISVLKGDTAVKFAGNNDLPSKTVWCLLTKDEMLYAGTSGGLFIDYGGTRKTLDQTSGIPGNRITSMLDFNSHLWAGSEGGVAQLNFDGQIVQVFTEADDEEFKSIRALHKFDGGFYMGAEGGVWEYKESHFEKLPSEIDPETSVYCLELDERGNLWAGTSDGLFLKRSNEESLIKLSTPEKLVSKAINLLQITKDNSLLIGSNNGLDAINLESLPDSGRLELRHFGKFEGLTGAETNQNAVLREGSEVWLGTTKGAIKFAPENKRKSDLAPALYISDIQLFLEDVDWGEIADSVSRKDGLPINPNLRYNQNYLTFNYSGIYFTNPNKVRYRYKLEGVDDEYLGPTESRSATYAYLPHGDFTFKVQAYQVDAPNKVSQSTFSFSIEPPFYLTNWFYSLIFVAVIAVIYLIYSARLKKEREKRANLKLQLQSRLMQLEAQSLNSSMNRHFIFNALNSIQYYINMQDRKSANRYLTSFAKLIRKNLDSSLQTDTSLNDELERLKLYLSLEQMRFQGKFDYNIKVDPSIDLDAVTLPAMMLQPFLENSIWHGILPSKKKGIINISITTGKNRYIIQIDDNGVGIDTSLKNKPNGREQHVSKGMDITLNRMKLYQNMTGKNYLIEGPYEVRDEKGNIQGTRLRILLPENSTAAEVDGGETWNFEDKKVI